MNTYTQRFLDNRTAVRACLRGAGGVHSHDLRTGTLSLVRQQLLELRQPRIVCAQGQVVIGGHQLEREVFQGDQSAGVPQFTGHLVPEITALVGDVLVQTGDLFSSRSRMWVGYRRYLYVRIIGYRPFCASM